MVPLEEINALYGKTLYFIFRFFQKHVLNPLFIQIKEQTATSN